MRPKILLCVRIQSSQKEDMTHKVGQRINKETQEEDQVKRNKLILTYAFVAHLQK